MNEITPIYTYQFARYAFKSIECRIKHDDLFPYIGGGSKSRKMRYIMEETLDAKHDCIVTNGGPQSNHARAAALMAANIGMKCHLVIHLDPGVRYPTSGNLLLMHMSGAKVEYCRKDQLAKRMDAAMEYYRQLGYNPAYIWGGGHCHAGTVAFVEAAAEAREQCGDWIPDYVIHASGTGTTQAGLAIGYADLPTKVIGISVARDAARGIRVINETIDDYYDNIAQSRRDIKVDFRDDWICGGYEKTTSQLLSIIQEAAKKGLILDPTYSGKAFYGLTDLIKQREISKGSKILFWHTGGLMNLMTSQLAENYISL